MPNLHINTLTDPAVRDLAWVIGSPTLLDAACPDFGGQVVDDVWCKAQLQASKAWLSALDLSPHVLHDFIAARPTRRLGHYFETLIFFWLKHRPDTHIIAANLQVQHEQRTLGEYDFLFRDAGAEVCHWEAAVKFYLQREPLDELRAFIGPGTKDRLDLKLDKVFQQQLQLGNTSAGQQALPGGRQLDKKQAFIKGYLFYNPSSPSKQQIHGVSAQHLKGWWVRHARESIPQLSADSHWAILPRIHWLAPARLTDDKLLMTYSQLNKELNEYFSHSRDALLVFEVERSTTGVWHEISRGFVVCSSWPDLNAN